MAPEIVQRKAYCPLAADIWSFGVVIYVILTGDFPFKGKTDKELYSKINQGLYYLPETLDYNAKKLIQRTIVVDPLKRMTAGEIFSDKWIN